MKNLLLLSLMFLTLLLASCSDNQKAKRMAKDYLSKNSNDGVVEIVEAGELEEFSYQDVSLQTELMKDAMNQLDKARHYTDMYLIFEGTKEGNQYYDSAMFYRAKADSLKTLSETAEVKVYPLKKMQLKARGNNAYGNKVVMDVTLYYDTDIKNVSVFPKEVVVE